MTTFIQGRAVEMTPDLLVTAGAGLAVVLGAVWRYVTVRGQGSGSSIAPLPTNQQVERITIALERLTLAVETISDKRQTDMQQTLHEIADKLTSRK